MWDMANDRDYIKIRNQEDGGGGWRQNKDVNTGGVICAEGLFADLVQRVFSNGSFALDRVWLVLLLLLTPPLLHPLLFTLCRYECKKQLLIRDAKTCWMDGPLPYCLTPAGIICSLCTKCRSKKGRPGPTDVTKLIAFAVIAVICYWQEEKDNIWKKIYIKPLALKPLRGMDVWLTAESAGEQDGTRTHLKGITSGADSDVWKYKRGEKCFFLLRQFIPAAAVLVRSRRAVVLHSRIPAAVCHRLAKVEAFERLLSLTERRLRDPWPPAKRSLAACRCLLLLLQLTLGLSSLLLIVLLLLPLELCRHHF